MSGTRVVDTSFGRLKGLIEGGVTRFLGAPYARPPVGPLRWRPPQQPANWSGVRDALNAGPMALQPSAPTDPGVGTGPMGEDCLYLNVWTPSAQIGPLPVLVWVHGGGLFSGSGSAPAYDGARLAQAGLIVVTTNYRLGRLGFFDHPALATERARDEPGGNHGLQDVMAALGWVQTEIAAFGGDPARVCVAGQSAGGALVLRLMIAEAARGLFQRAVVQSGLGRDRDGSPIIWRPELSAAELRALPAESLLTPPPDFYGGELALRDGVWVTHEAETAFREGRQHPVPLILGSNGREFDGEAGETLSPVRRFRAALSSKEAEALGPAPLATDLIFHEPARRLARLHAAAGHQAWLYRFPDLGHAQERDLLFGAQGRADARGARMRRRWRAFADSGDPNGETLAFWNTVAAAPDALMRFDIEGDVMTPVPGSARLDKIEAIQNRMGLNLAP